MMLFYYYTGYILYIVSFLLMIYCILALTMFKEKLVNGGGFGDIVMMIGLLFSSTIFLITMIPIYMGMAEIAGFIGLCGVFGFFIYGPDSRAIGVVLFLMNILIYWLLLSVSTIEQKLN
jgi:hypothetical protein